MNGARLAWDVLRAEGPAAFRDRLRDRLAFRRRQRGFRLVGEVDDPSRPPAPRATPVRILNVLPTAPRPDLGGVQVQLLRRLEAEAELRSWALLYPLADGYRLEVREGARREALTYRVAVDLSPERLSDPVFAAVARHAARWLGARAMHFEQLVGLPLEDVAELGRQGLSLVISVHDFGLFCVRPHLVERPALRFCGYCREAPRCARCLAQDWDVDDGFQQRRRRLAFDLLRSAAAVIYPSDFLRRTYAELVPEGDRGLDEARQWVLEPPSVVRPVRAPALETGRSPRHLAYVGSVKAHKGALLLEQAIHRFSGPSSSVNPRWSVYGGGDRDILRRLRGLPGVRLRGYYRAGDLPRLLRRDRVDLALLLSIWPESYALTLDECRLAGVPVLALDHGAIGERLRRYACGLAVSPSTAPDSVLDALETLLDRGLELPAETGRTVDFEPPDAVTAARRCLRIYRDLDLPANP